MNTAPILRRAVAAVRPAGRLVQPVAFKTSIIPPNVSSLKEIGKLQSQYPQAHPELFAKMKSFYARVPKGTVEKRPATGLLSKYYEAYHEKDSLMPIAHFVIAMVVFGYTVQYYVIG
ncbi:hypothetical protein BJ742DRAFT_92494 [Cladochytrium replicatum]|nr:hypothetical protein BJ742DRAFT_92494 [Cladochytrium replicatum]